VGRGFGPAAELLLGASYRKHPGNSAPQRFVPIVWLPRVQESVDSSWEPINPQETNDWCCDPELVSNSVNRIASRPYVLPNWCGAI
jgi:hypothetical protein